MDDIKMPGVYCWREILMWARLKHEWRRMWREKLKKSKLSIRYTKIADYKINSRIRSNVSLNHELLSLNVKNIQNAKSEMELLRRIMRVIIRVESIKTSK